MFFQSAATRDRWIPATTARRVRRLPTEPQPPVWSVATNILYRVAQNERMLTNSFHLLLSWTRVLQFGSFNFCISFLASSSKRVFSLPVGSLKWVSRSVLPGNEPSGYRKCGEFIDWVGTG
jgi:hypothetical protein